MNDDIENLIIDNYPKIDIQKMTITTEFMINSCLQISISVNNSKILSSSDIQSVEGNIIVLFDSTDQLTDRDNIVVIYNKKVE